MRLTYSVDAAADIREAARAWKRFGGPSASAFRNDLVTARALLRVVPFVGGEAIDAPQPGIRRLLLLRTGYWLYYSVNEAAREVVVLRLWHPKRGPLRPP